MSIARFSKKYVKQFLVAEDKRGDGPLQQPCWAWTGKLKDGYARIRVYGVIMRAHRYAYEIYRGGIPAGKVLDHLCRQRHCVNPYHLEIVSPKENTLRGESAPALNAQKNACPAGHVYTESNTYRDGRNKRYCRECQRMRASSRRKRSARVRSRRRAA